MKSMMTMIPKVMSKPSHALRQLWQSITMLYIMPVDILVQTISYMDW